MLAIWACHASMLLFRRACYLCSRTRAWLDSAPDFAVKSTPSAKTHRSRGPSAKVGVVQLRTWPVHIDAPDCLVV